MSDAAILTLLKSGALPNHALESHLGDAMRAVGLRRQYVESSLGASPLHATSPSPATPHAPPSLAAIPFSTFDAPAFYKSVLNTNCEAVIGFIPYPLGVVGPLPVDGVEYRVPMATTEGALVASTNRGCTALRRAGGVVSEVVRDGMTRAPLLQMPSLKEAAALKAWVEAPANTARLQEAFSSTSRFGKLASIDVTLAGRLVYMRFVCTTGDAMGMNMISKGVNVCLDLVK
jgi:hydroxymethylglutaryl-CoA reductase (NADPH)